MCGRPADVPVVPKQQSIALWQITLDCQQWREQKNSHQPMNASTGRFNDSVQQRINRRWERPLADLESFRNSKRVSVAFSNCFASPEWSFSTSGTPLMACRTPTATYERSIARLDRTGR